jgi:hypothetical protein
MIASVWTPARWAIAAMLMASMILFAAGSGVPSAGAATAFLPVPSSSRVATSALWTHAWVLRALAARTHRSRQRHPAKSSGSVHPQVRSRTITNGDALQLPPSAWPSNLTQKKGQSVSKSKADDAATILFANNAFHRQAYLTHGVQGGYDQNGQLDFGQFGDAVYAEWFGTYYATADQAAGRVADAVTSLGTIGMQSQGCYLDDQPNCRLFIFPLGLGPGQLGYIVYAIFSSGNGVGELALLSAPTTMVEHTDALGADFHTLLAAADSVLVAAGGDKQPPQVAQPPPPSATIGAVRLDILHIARGTLKATKTLHQQETAFFLAYFRVTGAGTYTSGGHFAFLQPKATLTLKENGTVIFTGPGQIDSTPNGDLYFDVEGSFNDPTTAGQVSVDVALTLGASSASENGDLTVTSTPLKLMRR